MEVYWLEQRAADVPDDDDWLGASELVRLATLRFPKRRQDWRLGRWTVKCALAASQLFPVGRDDFANIEIIAAKSGCPEVFFRGRPAAVTISISHREGTSICAVAGARVKLGCDLELIEPRTSEFFADYFTSEEQRQLAQAPCPFRLAAVLWSAKESALKAMREGLRVDTRSVAVQLDSAQSRAEWNPLQVRSIDGQLFHGWWREAEGAVQTVVAEPAPSEPTCVKLTAFPRISCR